MTRLAVALVVLGAVMTAVGVVPIRYLESGALRPITSTYFLMMILPAIIAVLPLLYQRARGLDTASIGVVLLSGLVISTIPFWGPSLEPRMQMDNAWIGTIVGHYLAGAIVFCGGLLQLREFGRRRTERLAA